jgi:hypothetical protein
MYRGKTIVFLGNEFSTGEFGRSSVTDAIDVAEINKLAAQGTSIFVCDVEMSRSRDMRRWLGDVVHRTSNIPGAHMFMELDDVVDCLRQKRDDTRYITSAKVGLTWEKSADKVLRLLLKQLPSRRFLISKHDETRICVRESLDLNCRVAVFFSSIYIYLDTSFFNTIITVMAISHQESSVCEDSRISQHFHRK